MFVCVACAYKLLKHCYQKSVLSEFVERCVHYRYICLILCISPLLASGCKLLKHYPESLLSNNVLKDECTKVGTTFVWCPSGLTSPARLEWLTLEHSNISFRALELALDEDFRKRISGMTKKWRSTMKYKHISLARFFFFFKLAEKQ